MPYNTHHGIRTSSNSSICCPARLLCLSDCNGLAEGKGSTDGRTGEPHGRGHRYFGRSAEFPTEKGGTRGGEKEEQPKDQKESAAADSPQNPVSTSDPVPAANRQEKTAEPEKPFHRPGYREAIMTDGILVEELFKQIEKLAETGCSDLGNVIYQCETAR